MYDAKADAGAMLWILHYVTTTEGKEKARAVIYEWLRHIQLREVRAMLLQYVYRYISIRRTNNQTNR